MPASMPHTRMQGGKCVPGFEQGAPFRSFGVSRNQFVFSVADCCFGFVNPTIDSRAVVLKQSFQVGRIPGLCAVRKYRRVGNGSSNLSAQSHRTFPLSDPMC